MSVENEYAGWFLEHTITYNDKTNKSFYCDPFFHCIANSSSIAQYQYFCIIYYVYANSFYLSIFRYIAGLKQKYTQSNGRRPFGISCLIGGFDYDGQPHLYQTEPSGIYYEWKANATGRSAKTVREFLEKYYNADEVATENGAVKLAIKALLEVAQSGQKNLEVAVMERDKPLKMLDSETIEKYVTIIEKEKEEEAEKKKQKK